MVRLPDATCVVAVVEVAAVDAEDLGSCNNSSSLCMFIQLFIELLCFRMGGPGRGMGRMGRGGKST